MKMPFALLLPALALAAQDSQAPHADWKTIATAHYRIHFPPSLAGWAQDIASRIEGVHRELDKHIGHTNPRTINVVLRDPFARGSGFAIPMMGAPYTEFWHTEPETDDLHAGPIPDWGLELAAHELGHLHHLTRPLVKPSLLARLSPVQGLVTRSPGWVTEGYATILEGRLTGVGRPQGPLRAALLRQRALRGDLPAYDHIGADSNLNYMLGSAYLEYLERQHPQTPDVLKRLWQQMVSKKHTSFEAAFKAVFGVQPQEPYGRFVAELTSDALALEDQLKAKGIQEGELWFRMNGEARGLALSPDGKRLLLESTAGLKVWELEPKVDPKAEKPDPQALPDVTPEFPDRKVFKELGRVGGQVPRKARWASDNQVAFQLARPDHEGILRLKPALWDFKQVSFPTSAPEPVLKSVKREGLWRLVYQGREVPLPGEAIGPGTVDPGGKTLYATCVLEGTWNLVAVPILEGGFGPVRQLTRTTTALGHPAVSTDGKWLFFTRLDARGLEVRRMATDAALPTQQAPAVHTRTKDVLQVQPPYPAKPIPREAVAEARPYRALDHQVGWPSLATHSGPAGDRTLLGCGGRDVLGRLGWALMGGYGSASKPWGAAASVDYAGLAWKPSLTLAAGKDRPSRQPEAPVLHRDRIHLSAELALTYDSKGILPWSLRPYVGLERSAWVEGRATERRVAGLSLEATPLRHLTKPLALVTRLEVQEARQEGLKDRALRGTASLVTDFFTLKGQAGRWTGEGTNRFRLGGANDLLLPAGLELTHLERPGLPEELASGRNFRSLRLEVGAEVRGTFEQIQVWNPGSPRPAHLRIAGLEGAMSGSPFPYLKTLMLNGGVNRILNGALRGETYFFVGVVVKP